MVEPAGPGDGLTQVISIQMGSSEARSFVYEYHCCVRARIGELGPEKADFWWNLDADISTSLSSELKLPRIVCAIILVQKGEVAEARRLLAAQASETSNPGHPAYVRGLAERLGVGGLDA